MQYFGHCRPGSKTKTSLYHPTPDSANFHRGGGGGAVGGSREMFLQKMLLGHKLHTEDGHSYTRPNCSNFRVHLNRLPITLMLSNFSPINGAPI